MNTIGRYQLVEKLGQGGMGVVYRAFDPLLQRVVAVKLIGAIETNDELRERFFREARAAGQLSHKNIITIHDLGEHERQPFLAMEFLEGQDLQQRMAGHAPMTLARKLELAVEICEGIEYAHVHGVIHRDIKPANIFITTGGTAKILDFGLARIITSELTNSNMMMGTLNYMAPEQVRGERADQRSDIFSTGVVLYELLGGRKAFEGDSFAATLYKILQEVPEPLPHIDANLPPELVGIVERALEKTREARYQHMSEMVGDLRDYRQRLMLLNSPGPGMLAHDAATMASVPVTPIPAARPPSARSAVSDRTSDRTIAAATPPAAPETTAPPPHRRTGILAVSLACVVLVGALIVWSTKRGPADPPRPAEVAATPPADTTQQDIASRLEQASKALQGGDGATAQRHADAVLALSPGHVEAQRLRDRAQQAASAVTRSLANARGLLTAGRFDEASRAAGEVLAVDPGNAEAKRLMDEGAARSRGKGVDDARVRTGRAKNAAAGAGAATLAAGPYAAAVAAERDAATLYKRGQFAESMARFWEASGLFRSAEIAAQTEAAVRTERSRTAQAERKPADPPSQPPPQAPPAPVPPTVPTSAPTSLPLPPPSSIPVAPAAPPAPPPSAAQPAADLAASAASGIKDVLDRYKAALESRSLESLKRLWPGLGGAQESAIRYEFQNAKRIDVEIGSPQINVNAATATATFVRRYQLETVDRQRLSTETRTTMNLHRSGTSWVIDRIKFEPIR